MEGDQRGPTCREGAWAYEGVSWPHWARGTRPHRAQPANLGLNPRGASRRGGNLPPTPPSLVAGPRVWGTGKGWLPTPLYKEGWGRTPSHTSSSSPSRPAALLSLSLPTA